MKNKWFKVFLVFVFVFTLISVNTINANADIAKVMWGKTELKKGQIGKVTILSNTNLLDQSLKSARSLKKGEEYRVYSYKSTNGGLYGLGGGQFVKKGSSIKYETPSKSKLALLNMVSKIPLEVHFIDVGQGDSILIKTANGKTMLVDGGKKGSHVVSFLSSKGVRKLDYVVATHPDADHIGGLVDVLHSYSVGTFINSGKAHTTQTYAELLTLVGDKNIKYKVPKIGDKISLDENIDITVLNANENASDTNDASIVLKVTYYQVSFLLTGDAGANMEEQMYKKFNVQSTVLKAGHHGSDTSSSNAFIQRVKPQVTILSYGKDNSYGHPHAAVVSRLKNVGSKIYSTAESGSITVSTNGLTYSVSAKPWTGSGTGVVTSKPAPPKAQIVFSNCTELRKVYPNGVPKSHTAYQSKMDRDNDGWACEK